MSRYYNLTVEFKRVKLEVVQNVLAEFGWNIQDGGEEGKNYAGYVSCDGYLCGGQGEDEAHEEISKEIKKKCPLAKVLTRWTYMEDLPYNEFGDDLDEEDDIKDVVKTCEVLEHHKEEAEVGLL